MSSHTNEHGSIINTNESAIRFQLNGKSIQKNLPPAKRLVEVLREDCELTGTKLSCGVGRCGACAVLIDGKLTASCLTMAYQAEGKSVTTIEHLAKDEELHPVQQAFLENGGFQCGYCTPGMIISVDALLTSHESPSEDQIKEALSGNLCRCTGYGGIVRSIQHILTQEKEGMHRE
ncbi:carbon-monoxide dehydrogenase small subunit [Alkalicoccobacillus murimartini]|uniref:Carbon-monoxide dehydrogenase small subunit n=1 Tax=Alkalicoccobacillus murimartini TaxID=171685 RepID=A0ABT9YFU5_9BACI|nr:(2Fe-2S)-binding protein [Alkalicoccobacillus murimartini]MDQ0206733.1 carbon-monoxide dehydrogenase small subunit [Alkalicoccobacillus murimartini]